MIKVLKKHQLIYIFLIIISLIGFISGYTYYKIQDKNTKEEIKEKYKIENTMSLNNTNILKDLKTSFIILISSFLIIPQIITIFYIFYYPFKYGFLLSYLLSISKKFAIKYMLIYHLVPFIILIIMTRISINISKEIISYLLNKKPKNIKKIQLLLYKYIFILFILIIYEIIICIFSLNINKTLIPFL